MADHTQVVTLERYNAFARHWKNEQKKLQQLALVTFRPERMFRITVACFQRNPLLWRCTDESLLYAVSGAVEMGLEPGGMNGLCYLVPFYNSDKKRYEAVMIPGYRGLCSVARRGGTVTRIEARVVYRCDVERGTFRYQFGNKPLIEHIPAPDPSDVELEDQNLLYNYTVAYFADGSTQFDVMRREEVLKIKAKTKSRNKQGVIVGPWVTDEPEMWKKTGVRRLYKMLPVDDLMTRVMEQEDNAEAGVFASDYIDIEGTLISEEQHAATTAAGVKDDIRAAAERAAGHPAATVEVKTQSAPSSLPDDIKTLLLNFQVSDVGIFQRFADLLATAEKKPTAKEVEHACGNLTNKYKCDLTDAMAEIAAVKTWADLLAAGKKETAPGTANEGAPKT